MRSLAALAAAIVLAGAAGCSLLVTTSGLGGDEPAGDAGVAEGGDGSPPDGAPFDGSTASDADASVLAPDGASPCTSPHRFCDDFDTGGTNLSTRWDSLRQAAGPLSLDTAQSLSAPRALRATLTPGTGTRASELRKVVTPGSATVRIDFDAFSDGVSSSSFVEIDPFGVDLIPPPAGFRGHGVAIVIYPSSSVLQYHANPTGVGPPTVVEAVLTAPLSRWVHVRMTIDYAAAPPVARVELDGIFAAQVKLAGAAPTSVEVSVGLIYTDEANTTFSSLFDNIVVD